MKTDKTINQLISEFLANQDISKGSLNNYRKTLNLFVLWMTKNGIDVSDPKHSDVIMYKQHLLDTKELATADNYITSVKVFCRFLHESGYTERDISENLRPIRLPKKHSKGFLEPAQIDKLLDSPKLNSHIGFRDKAILHLMVTLGLRCIEVSRLLLDDVYNEGDNYFIKIQRKGKNAKEDLALPKTVFGSIEEYLSAIQIDHKFLFVSLDNKKPHSLTSAQIGRIVEKHLKQSGLKKKNITPHSLRHSAAINALRNGADIYQVQSMLGHCSLNVTEIYLRASGGQDNRMNEAIFALDRLYTSGKNLD